MPKSDEEKTTTERVTVDAYQSSIGDYLVYLFHVATYEFARPLAEGQRVLDFGCGTGYGTHMLAHDCREIVGVDISEDAVRYAQEHYQAPSLHYRTIAPVEDQKLPFEDESFDTVLSFQVIEHINDVNAYLAEIRRVLAPSGVFVCATPDRTLRLFHHQRPWNMYHVHEYQPDELHRLLRNVFQSVEIHGMTAEPALIARELKRVRRARIVSLPVTFPGVPERVRRRGLALLKRLHRVRSSGESSKPLQFAFGHEAISIAPDAEPSVNIVAVATRN